MNLLNGLDETIDKKPFEKHQNGEIKMSKVRDVSPDDVIIGQNVS